MHPASARKHEAVDRLSGKTGKEDAHYRASKHEDKRSCLECLHYLFPGNKTSSCRRVAGLVYAEDMCDLFTSRSEEGQGQSVQPSMTVEINIGKGK